MSPDAGEWIIARLKMILMRAPVIVPVRRPVIEDGAVLVSGGRIRAVDSFRNLRGTADVLEYEDRVLTPSLVNAHCHLELSHLAELGSRKYSGPLTGWIQELLDLRLAKGEKHAGEAGAWALSQQKERGVGLVLDVGNLPESKDFAREAGIRRLFLLEMMGISRQKEEQTLRIAEEADLSCTPHAPYSCGPRLLKYLKKRAEGRDEPYSIHTAESREEIRFLEEGRGPFRDFLEKKGLWDGFFRPPGCGPVKYLEGLGLLDRNTLCIHCVHVSSGELDILAARKSRICLCPTSNRQLGVGRAPLREMLARDILPALGTDSLASNPDLDIWEEMALIRRQETGIDPATVFAMATLGGAEACGVDDLGVLAPGYAASILALDSTGIPAGEIMEYLTSGNMADKVEWAEH